MNIEKCTPEEIDRFKIENALEIERVLRGIMESKSLVTVYGENNRNFMVTSLVAIDGPGKAVYFGAGPDAATDQAIVASGKASFNTAHDHVRVLFSTPGLAQSLLAGERVLRAEMPKEILRFQRREFYRLPTPVTHPVKCLIDLKGSMLEAVVQDISLGGVGVLAYNQDVKLRVGDVFNGCRLSIPDSGNFVVSLSVRTVYEQTLKNGTLSHRAGCQFINLSSAVETDIQRYIIRVERERRLGNH